MSTNEINRRDAVKLMALMAAASGFHAGCAEPAEPEKARGSSRSAITQPDESYRRQFFTDHEYETVRALADMIIPADERSGNASDAGVPAFIDFVMMDEALGAVERRQTTMRGGLAWLDHTCRDRFGNRPFVDCSEEERVQILDLIAYPEGAPPELAAGVRFFNTFRDLTIAGFFSSRMGVEDLNYIGNAALPEFTGCPPEVLEHVGLNAPGAG